MAPNPNNKTVDTMLKELNNIFTSHYLGYKKHQVPYKEIIDKIKVYKNAHEKNALLIAIQEKIDEREHFSNLESTIWGILFAIIGLFIAMISDLILSNYDILIYFQKLSPDEYVSFTILFACIIIVLYCLSTRRIRKKTKEICYYKFVYNYLSQ